MQAAPAALLPAETATDKVAVSVALLCLTSFLTTLDRLAFPLLIEPIRLEFALSDTQIGLLTGIAFTAMYALASIPIARWADAGDRRFIIALSLGVWSAMTALCGLAQSIWQLFATRFGVGIGEAGSYAPAQSLIADYHVAERRALPLALFAVLVGGGFGPLMVGVLSDGLQTSFGTDSLRYSLVAATLLMLWAAFHLYWASQRLQSELED